MKLVCLINCEKINIITSNERSEYFFIGLADLFCFFFQEKVFKICSHSVLVFRRLVTCDFFKVQCISIVKRKASSFMEQQKCKGHEKRDRLLISKMEINYQISQIGVFLTKKCPS